jgi:BMFP domain-containing protein YqiC
MARTTIDDLIAAIDAVRILKETVDRQGQALLKVVDKLDEIEKRLASIEATRATPRAKP